MAAPENVDVSLNPFIQRNNQLALNLHKTLAREGKNAFFSPFSVSSALAMLLHGLKGEADDELRKCLGYTNIDNETVAYIFQSLIESFENFPDGYTISYANSMVFQKDFEILEQYKSDLKNYFKALCMESDFAAGTDVVEKINKWVKENTNNMIPKLMDSVDSNTVAVLLNAIYFKGFWLKQFQETSTCNQYFYNDGIEDNAQLVEMMHLTEKFLWVEKESYKVLQLPYKGEEIAMLVFLPNSRDGLHQMEDLLAPDFVSNMKNELHEGKLKVALPKFRLEFSIDLKDTFRELGVKQIFQAGADFGGISQSKDLFVSQIVHKACLEVNEEGCEAAAVTAVVKMRRSIVYVPEFIVDHPFAFVIYNVQNDLIFFMGRVTAL